MERRLRYYPNVLKLMVYLLGGLAFVLIGVWLLKTPARSGSNNILVGWLATGVFGLCLAVLIAMIVATLARRMLDMPVLEFTSQGIAYSHPLLRGHFVRWDEVRDIAIYRQRMTRTSMYYLVVNARMQHQLPHSGVRMFTARVYPALSAAVLSVPLNRLFLVLNRAMREKLLKQIASTFAPELQHYGIQIDGQLRKL